MKSIIQGLIRHWTKNMWGYGPPKNKVCTSTTTRSSNLLGLMAHVAPNTNFGWRLEQMVLPVILWYVELLRLRRCSARRVRCYSWCNFITRNHTSNAKLYYIRWCICNVMKPFLGKNRSYPEKIFSYRLSQARRVFEKAFGILAQRLLCLLGCMYQVQCAT